MFRHANPENIPELYTIMWLIVFYSTIFLSIVLTNILATLLTTITRSTSKKWGEVWESGLLHTCLENVFNYLQAAETVFCIGKDIISDHDTPPVKKVSKLKGSCWYLGVMLVLYIGLDIFCAWHRVTPLPFLWLWTNYYLIIYSKCTGK